MKKFRYIDSLRGFAILGVLFIHAGFSSAAYPKSWYNLINSGQYGVQLFFVTSAFTLFLSLHQREKDYLSSREFFIRRFFRIAPMYYVGILYYTFERFIGFSYLLTGTPRYPIPVDALISNIFFVHGVHPLWLNGYVPGGWSITVEMTFYLFVPLLFKKIRNIDQAVLLFAGSLLASVIIHELLVDNPWFNREFFLYCFFPNQLRYLLWGLLPILL
jgi:peptidoglycan/LPS O-acetylase OafA/YrhL